MPTPSREAIRDQRIDDLEHNILELEKVLRGHHAALRGIVEFMGLASPESDRIAYPQVRKGLSFAKKALAGLRAIER